MGRAEMGRRRRKIILLWPVCRHAVLGGTDGRSGSFSFHLCVSANWTSPHSNSHTDTTHREETLGRNCNDVTTKWTRERWFSWKKKNCTKSIIDFRVQIPPPAQGPPFKKHTKIVVSAKPSVGREDFFSWVDRQNWRHLLWRLVVPIASLRKIQTTANNFLLVTYTPRLLFD